MNFQHATRIARDAGRLVGALRHLGTQRDLLLLLPEIVHVVLVVAVGRAWGQCGRGRLDGREPVVGIERDRTGRAALHALPLLRLLALGRRLDARHPGPGTPNETDR
jgi:hypothetical protein